METEEAQEGCTDENSDGDDGFEYVELVVFLGALVDGVVKGVHQVDEDHSLEQVQDVGSPNAEVLEVLEEGSGHQEPKDQGHYPYHNDFDEPHALINHFYLL